MTTAEAPLEAKDFAKHCRKIVAAGLSYDYNWPGKNYRRSDALETKPEPMIFLKPPSSFAFDGGVIDIHRGCDVFHEIELALVIGRVAREVSLEEAETCIAGYALALDLTAKNVQAEAKSQGRPWTTAKGLDTYTPISQFIAKHEVQDAANVDLALHINDKLVQSGNTGSLIYSAAQLVSYISGVMTLQPGDVILTGSPKNVDRIHADDKVNATLSSNGKVLASLALTAKHRSTGYSFQLYNR